MKLTFVLLALCAAVSIADGALKLKSLCPAKVNGRFTGQIAASIEESHARVKRQRGNRRPMPERNGRRRRTTAQAATTVAPTTASSSTSSPSSSSCSGASDEYRTADGTCNNKANSQWGAVLAPFRRLLPASYQYINGNNAPRTLADSSTNVALPGPREVSVRVHTPDDRPDGRAPVMVMQWGQFLDHDITGTPVSIQDGPCCSDSLVTSGTAQHGDVSSGGPCFPILIAANDRHFNTTSSRCMEFVRSFRTDGETDEEQVNLLTAFIDASQVYGTSDSEMASLRGTDGKLREGNDGFLPAGSDDSCTLAGDGSDYCLLAGDSRANVFPGLGAMHTVFLREHNLLATGLKARNPQLDDEEIFQTARKIVGALMQHITYDEYLPTILGDTVMATYELSSSNQYSYRSDLDPTLANVFSTAAFRFGHSAIPDNLLVGGSPHDIRNVFSRPALVLSSLQGIVEGLLEEPSQRVDRWYATDMTDHLFETGTRESFDIVALNIQRGRDHGLPPYTTWRDYCGLSPIQSFDDMGNSGRVYQRIYESVDHIDLYSGALNERPVDRGSVGETYACLLGIQFQALKYGDRFWYENPSSEGFTTAQLAEIKKMSLSGVLCDAFDNGLTIQPNAFTLADVNGRNNAVPCSQIDRLDLDAWA